MKNLPIYSHLDEICQTLKNSPSCSLILTAETGAGKSTALPVALLKHFPGKIYMLEPRRLAVLNIANRVCEILGEEVGNTCGYIMRLENKVTDKTRLHILTEAILTRKIQSDPMLEGVSVVVIDEFHERSIHADQALAFLKEVLTLRDDLYVVIMSATMDTEALASYMGNDGTKAAVYHVEGRCHEVQIEYEDNKSPAKAAYDEVRKLKDGDGGSVLVFLPGIAEIRKTKEELLSLGADKLSEVCILHSSVPYEEQKAILKAGESKRKRIILSSAIAETSLTIPDIRVVVDSGLYRTNIYNQSIGMDQLVTMNVSEFSAAQRAGRAGRLTNGKCVRLWNKNEVLVKSSMPEILRADLSALVLECAEWGAKDASSLQWFDKPPKGAWLAAKNLLEKLNCLKEENITPLGKAVLGMGTGVRLSCVALSGFPTNNADFSTGIASECDPAVNISTKMMEKQRNLLKIRGQKWKKNPLVFETFPQVDSDFSTACALLSGFPDRLCKKQADGLYLLPSGRMVGLPEDKAFTSPDYLIATDISATDRQGIIRKFYEMGTDEALNYLNKHSETKVKVSFEGDSQKLVKKEILCYGKIVLKKKVIPVSKGDYILALAEKVKEEGLEWLPLTNAAENLLLRCQFYIQQSNEKGTELEERYNNLKENAAEWLGPFIPEGEKVSGEKIYSALYWYLDGDRLKESVPVEIILPNGKKRKLIYENQNGKIVPVLEIIIQQIFGCFTTPKVMGHPLLLKLLSPARRPLQITSDLENFWKETWPEICSEMKGRYPKHNWDYRVTSKEE